METKSNSIFNKAWLYLLPSILLLGVFLIYPLVDVLIYSFEENYGFVSQTYTGIGFYNYGYILRDKYFLQSLKNTFIIVIITVPLSTILALLISVALNSIKAFQKAFQTIFFLPYVTNVLAIGLVFLIIFDSTEFTSGIFNQFLSIFNISKIDFIDGPHWAKMFVICTYIIWSVMPFKILILVGALQGIDKKYYDAAAIDQASKGMVFRRITVPLVLPYLSYLLITGCIGAFKQYNECVALFGVDLNAQEMNTIVGYIYNMLYDERGGYPSYASAAAIVLFIIVLTITVINLLLNKKMDYRGN